MECASLCMLKPQPSSMRVHSLKSVTQFKWNHLNKELRKKAPTLLASEEDALLGLLPFASDWHAEANYLEVRRVHRL